MQPSFFDYGSNIELGERVFFDINCVVLGVRSVNIASFTVFGAAVQIYTPMHPFSAELRRREEVGKPVKIGSDVRVSGDAIILPGMRLGFPRGRGDVRCLKLLRFFVIIATTDDDIDRSKQSQNVLDINGFFWSKAA
jgi:hypothetical protein